MSQIVAATLATALAAPAADPQVLLTAAKPYINQVHTSTITITTTRVGLDFVTIQNRILKQNF